MRFSRIVLAGILVTLIELSVGGTRAFAQFVGNVSGTAASPSYTWLTDLTTGIFRPAASTLSVSTGGAERLRINSSGNVGIGTTTPSRLLQIAGAMKLTPVANPGTPTAGDIYVDSTASNILKYHNGSAWVSVTAGGSGDFLANGSVTMTNNFRLGNNWLSNDGGAEGFKISTDGDVVMGNVGLGLSYVNVPVLAISRAGLPPYIYFEDSGNDTMMFGKDSADFFAFASESSMNGITFKVDGAFSATPFITNATNAMTIRTSGNVGIGTTNPDAKLHVSGDVKMGNSSATCNSTAEGSQRYNSTSKRMEFCDGSNWQTVGLPAGAVDGFAQATCPAGWIAANGAAVSRTTYAALYTALSTSYGAGDGSTTFNLPDYRGYFLRGWANGSTNDPDRASRTNRGDGTTGDDVGTKQADEFKAHTHNETNAYFGGVDGATGGGATYYYSNQLIATGSTGGNESRPKNINVLYCVKY